MLNTQRFPFIKRTNSSGQTSTLPYLPLTLSNGNNSVEVMALLDTGASINVLPYAIGIQLGAVWENQTVQIPLSGNIAQSEARGLVLAGTVDNFPPLLKTSHYTPLIHAKYPASLVSRSPKNEFECSCRLS